MRSAIFVALAGILTACSLDEAGDAVEAGFDGSVLDAPADVVADVREEPVVCTDAGAASCADAALFRTPALFSADAGAPCPSGYDTYNLAYAIAQAPTCGCQCTDGGMPSCDTSKVQLDVGPGGTCPQDAGATPLPQLCNGANQLLVNGEGIEVDPPSIAGGCGGGTSIAPPMTSTNVRLCMPQCANDDSVCHPQSGLRACMVVPGNVGSCPAGYATGPFYVGALPSIQCDACSCIANGDCTGSTLHLYTSGNCGNGDKAIPADGTCNNVNGGAATYGSMKLQGMLKGQSYACAVTQGAANVLYNGGNAFTVCCD